MFGKLQIFLWYTRGKFVISQTCQDRDFWLMWIRGTQKTNPANTPWFSSSAIIWFPDTKLVILKQLEDLFHYKRKYVDATLTKHLKFSKRAPISKIRRHVPVRIRIDASTTFAEGPFICFMLKISIAGRPWIRFYYFATKTLWTIHNTEKVMLEK